MKIATRPRIPKAVPREMRSIAAMAVEVYGWKIWIADGSKHVCWLPPGGKKAIQTSLTPSDQRSQANEKSRLRRAGLPVPHRGQEVPRKSRRQNV